jgi:hypothetical protein
VAALRGAFFHPAHVTVMAGGEECFEAVAGLGAERGRREADGVEAEGQRLGADGLSRAAPSL